MHLSDNDLLIARRYKYHGWVKNEKLAQEYLESYRERLAALEPFDTFVMGQCPLASSCKPPEFEVMAPVTWMVLHKIGRLRLVISRDCLDWEFFSGEGGVSWKRGYARERLNQELLPKMFTPPELAMVCETPISQNNELAADRLFLLSAEEFEAFFRGADASAELYFCDKVDDSHFAVQGEEKSWWLRTPSEEHGNMVVVDERGELDLEGFNSDADEIGLRPAMWLDLDQMQL